MLKVYVIHNLDGRNSAMAAAESMKAAAEAMYTSVYNMRQMGWNRGNPDDAKVALATPGVCFYRPIDNLNNYPWSKIRYARDFDAGPMAYRLIGTQ